MSEFTSYALTHQEFLLGLIGGFALGHLDDLVAYGFHFAMKLPFLRAWIVAHPEKAKGIVDAIQKDLDKLIDEESTAGSKTP